MDKSRVTLQAGKTSPIVSKTFTYQKGNFPPRKLIIRAVINLILSLILLYEILYNYVQCLLGIAGPVFNGFLAVLVTILVLNCLVDFSHAATKSKQSNILPLSPEQKKLMGVKHDATSGYPDACDFLTPRPKCVSCPHLFNLSNISPQSSTPHPHSHVSFSPDSSSPQYRFGRSSFINSSGESFSLPHRKSPFFNSPLPEDDFMTDQRTLTSYLKAYFENQSQGLFGNHPINEDLIELSKTAYQLSARSKSPTTSQDKKDDLKKVASSEYWFLAGIDEDRMREAVARLRQWIALVILRGLVREIDHVNKLLKQHGLSEIQVGESSLNSLKQVQLAKGSEIVKLAWLLPFLEVTSHQEYLVERIRRLASGGYMSDFKWNKGGSIKGGREWNDDLITDSELVMHLFCVHFDLHVPNDPRFPDGKSFTSQFFVKTPDKPKMSKIDDGMTIYQHQLHPPHFRLVTKDVTYDVPSGQHNMLCSILLFLHHLKTKRASRLGQVKLGLSGINVLYVIEPLLGQTGI